MKELSAVERMKSSLVSNVGIIISPNPNFSHVLTATSLTYCHNFVSFGSISTVPLGALYKILILIHSLHLF